MNKQTSLKSDLTGELPLGIIHTAAGSTFQKLYIFCEHLTTEGKLSLTHPKYMQEITP